MRIWKDNNKDPKTKGKCNRRGEIGFEERSREGIREFRLRAQDGGKRKGGEHNVQVRAVRLYLPILGSRNQ